MLGIRLSPETEAALDRHARAIGRPKSVVARDWIVERLTRESIDSRMAAAGAAIAADERARMAGRWNPDSVLEALDIEDGGYDWGPEGSPP